MPAAVFALVGSLVGAPFAAANGPQRNWQWAPDTPGGYASDRIVVRITPQRAAAIKSRPVNRGGVASGVDVVSEMPRRFRRSSKLWNVRRMRPLFSTGFGDPELAAQFGLDRYYVLEVPRGTDTPAMAAAMAAQGDDIELAELDAIGTVADIPNDPLLSSQYSLDNTGQQANWCVDADINAIEAWQITTGDPSVVIAIIDSGVSPHSDLNDNMVPGRNVLPFADPNDTSDNCGGGHGTHVAGIAAAVTNNEAGIAGVCWNASIMPVRALFDCGGSSADVAVGIQWAVDAGADVINISLQFYSPEAGSTLTPAVNYAHARGAVIVAATGNDNAGGFGVVAFPAALDKVIAVSATTACDEFATPFTAKSAWFSNFGPETDLCAPGDAILSTLKNNLYGLLSGTSMATPHVSGVAALVLSSAPELTNVSVENILMTTTDDLGPVGWDDHYGTGRINAASALLLAPDWPQVVGSDVSPNAIDARRPHPPDDPDQREGWSWFDLTFRGNRADVELGDLFFTDGDGAATTNAVAGIDPIGDGGTLRIVLDNPIAVRAWTQITHTPSNTGLRAGSLPGDVTGEGFVSAADIDALINALSDGAAGSLPTWSVDINRSGRLTPADIIELIDLHNGGGSFDEYRGATLRP